MAEHFVAHLKIEKITKPDTPQNRPLNAVQDSGRTVDEVTQITLKGATLESLVDKLGKHIAIIEED